MPSYLADSDDASKIFIVFERFHPAEYHHAKFGGNWIHRGTLCQNWKKQNQNKLTMDHVYYEI